MDLLEVLKEYSPKVLSSGQINIQCAFPENHSADSQKRLQMFISPGINAYHCFSCGAKGKLTTLLTNKDKFNVPFFEALEMVHIDTYEKTKKADLSDTDYYWTLESPEEFVTRGFKETTLSKFKVGRGEKGEIVIPMYWNDVLRGLKYRVNKPKRKFWYSSDFDKESYLYNGDAEYRDYCILVEGETDLWRLLEWGFQPYGTLGTSLSEFQLEHIAKCKKVYLAGNTDLAGIKATKRWYEKLHKFTDVEILNLPANDVCDCTYREFKNAFNNPCSFAEFNYLINKDEEET